MPAANELHDFKSICNFYENKFKEIGVFYFEPSWERYNHYTTWYIECNEEQLSFLILFGGKNITYCSS